MAKTLAVLAIHGMGEQRKKTSGNSAELSFSSDLRDKVRGEMGAERFDGNVAWREAYWADLLQAPQEKYVKEMKKVTHFGALRSFVMYRLSDAASYNPQTGDKTDPDSTYARVHKCIRNAIADLDADCAGAAPLVVLAHSLGGYMMSNYIYDTVKFRADPAKARPTDFQNLLTFGGFVTFGCNIPVFMFSVKKMVAIRYPGAQGAKSIKPWWSNFYDGEDPLGYPLIPLGGDYQRLADEGGLKDFKIDAGTIFTSWNPLSHNAYWTDRDFFKPVAKALDKLVA
ncbi:MAG: hypothetical protein ACKVPY_12430 [Paracoccaceae bacterium]